MVQRLWNWIVEPKTQIAPERQLFSNRDLKLLILPLFGEQFLAMLVGIADTMMVSYAGEAAVSGVSLVNMLNTFFIYLFTALASGGAVVVSQYIGHGDPKNGNLASGQLYTVSFLFSVVCMAVALVFDQPLLQLLFGLDALKGISAMMVVGSIFLDYILAFTVLGLAGMFRGKIKNDAAAFTLGSFVSMMLRYFCSFLSGWVLWASFNETADMQGFIATFFPALGNLSGTALAVVYSLVYNGSYMIPEIILTCVVGFLLVQFAGKQILDKAPEKSA